MSAAKPLTPATCAREFRALEQMAIGADVTLLPVYGDGVIPDKIVITIAVNRDQVRAVLDRIYAEGDE